MEERQSIIIEIGTKIDNSGFIDLQESISETSGKVADLSRQISGVGQTLKTEVGQEVQDVRIRHGFEKKQEVGTMSDMPYMSSALENQLSRLNFTQKFLSDRIQHARADEANGVYSGFGGERRRQTEVARINDLKDDYLTVKEMILSQSGDFSVELAKNMLGGLPQALRKELDGIVPILSAGLKEGFSSGKLKGSARMENTVYEALKLPTIQRAIETVNKNLAASGSTQRVDTQIAGAMSPIQTVLRALIPTAAPIQTFKQYSNLRYGSNAPVLRNISTVEDMLPKFFKGTYAAGTGKVKLGDITGGYLSREGAEELLHTIANNAVALRAAKKTGLVSVGDDGSLGFGDKKYITPKAIQDYAQVLYKEFETRSSGLYSGTKIAKGDYYGRSAEKQADIIKKGLSGTAGETLAAMSALSDIVSENNMFVKGNDVRKAVSGLSAAQQVRDKKDIFTVDKYSPFITDTSKNVVESTMQESLATRSINKVLGRKAHGDHEKFDSVIELSAEGFDISNDEHVKKLRGYISNGYESNGRRYRWAGLHGTGPETVHRFVEESVYDAVDRMYEPQAKAIFGNDGVKRSFWSGYVPTDYEFKDRNELIKHIEMLGKMWSDTNVVASPAKLKDKKFAFVDYGKDGVKYADGVGYVADDILPQGSIQGRFALGGKGSLVPMRGSTYGTSAYGQSLKDDQGRIMMTGVGGDKIDVSDANGIFDISLIKNIPAYKKLVDGVASGQLTSEEFNRRATDLISMTGIDAIYSYAQDNTGVKSLGSQASAYVNYTPELAMAQTKEMIERFNAVETLEGARKYIFNNPESDEISRRINDSETGARYFALMHDGRSHEGRVIRDRIDTWKKSQISAMAAGDWIDTGGIADITKARIVSNPGLSDALYAGDFNKLSNATAIKDAFISEFGDVFTDDQIARMWTLGGGFADFSHNFFNRDGVSVSLLNDKQKARRYNTEDSSLDPLAFIKNLGSFGEKLTDEQFDSLFQDVAAIVSPTGFGQTLVRKNFAPVLGRVYKALGLYAGEDGNSVMLNAEDLKYLSTRDQDGDILKMIADAEAVKAKYGVSFVETLKKQEEDTKRYLTEHNINPDELRPKVTNLPTVQGGNNVSNVEAIIEQTDINANKAPLAMGAASKAGTRLTQLGLLKDASGYLAGSALLANNTYDETTVLFKTAKEVEMGDRIREALSLGKEYREFSNAVTGLFDVKKEKLETPIDGKKYRYVNANGEEIDEKDIKEYRTSESSEGRVLLNVGALRKAEVDKINLPSVLSSNMGLAMIQQAGFFKNGITNSDFYSILSEALGVGEFDGGLDFDKDAGPESMKFLKTKELCYHNSSLNKDFL